MGKLLVQRLDPRAKLPVVANAGEDLGYDIHALEDTFLEPNKPVVVKTGISACYVAESESVFRDGAFQFAPINPGRPVHGLEIKDRSSMAAKNHVHTLAGVIDAGYRGEIGVVMVLLGVPQHRSPNWRQRRVESWADLWKPEVDDARLLTGAYPAAEELGYQIKSGDKIAQLLPREVLTDTVEEVETLPEFGSRGTGGYGSSGK